MLIKFLPHGQGSCARAVRYLLKEGDKEKVTVLRGDPFQVSSLADSLSFTHRYSSAVIGFAPEDAPTDDEIDKLLDDFRETMGPGMGEDRLAYTAIRHEEPGGRIAIHILCARVDLETGKSYNPAPPKWQSRYDPLRDAWNFEKGWSRPDDPARSRDSEHIQPNRKDRDTRESIIGLIAQKVEAGLISDRGGVKRELIDMGFTITREGKDYLSVKDAESGNKFRLKGAYFEAGYRTDRRIEVGGATEREDEKGRRDDRESDARRALEAREEHRKQVERVAEYNQKRYRKVDHGLEDTHAQDMDASRLGDRDHGTGRGRGRSGVSVVRVEQTGIDISTERPGEVGDRDTGTDDSRSTVSAIVSPGDKTDARPRGEPLLTADRLESRKASTDRERHGIRPDISDHSSLSPTDPPTVPGSNLQIGDTHDRDRKAIDAELERLHRVSRDTLSREREANRSLVTASQRLVEASRGFEKIAPGDLKERMVKRLDAELEHFKTLSLGDIAKAFGYEKAKGSSKNSLKMEGPDGDKIVIATDRADGHAIYFSTRDSRDKGSVIDFVQKRLDKSLGEVRKWLRSYLGKNRPEMYARPLPSSRTEQEIMKEIESMSKEPSKYLLEDRKISLATLEDPRFKDRILVNSKGSAVFPHYADGLGGYEVKGKGFTGFAEGGEKGLWYSDGLELSRKIVICESAIDCLSHAELHQDISIGYVSIAGTLSDKQRRELGVLAKGAEAKGIEIVIAVDKDRGGEKITEDLKTIFKDAGIELPDGKDWNSDLISEKEKQARDLERAKSQARGREIEFEM